jgi:ElaB/YqjD/DUF883 family membrane-anchored ribosome-binding protein
MEHTGSEKISEALKLLEEAAVQKKDELKHAMHDKYAHLKDVIVEAEGNLVKAAVHAKDVSVEKAKEIASDVDKSVHRNPWPYIGGTAAVALLLGYILGRNRK